MIIKGNNRCVVYILQLSECHHLICVYRVHVKIPYLSPPISWDCYILFHHHYHTKTCDIWTEQNNEIYHLITCSKQTVKTGDRRKLSNDAMSQQTNFTNVLDSRTNFLLIVVFQHIKPVLP